MDTLTRSMRQCTAIVLSLSLLAACARNRYAPAPTVPTDDPAFSPPEEIVFRGIESDPPQPLRLFPCDVVQLTTVSAQIQVFEGLIVDELGQLHVPLAGDIRVGGMPLGQAEKAIERGLRNYDRFARANVIITDLAGGHSATVVGQVQTPGRYTVTPGMRLGDLLALAGGAKLTESQFTPVFVGNLDLARLVRDGEALPVSVRLAMEGDPKHNVRVRPGDQLFVPGVAEQLIMVLGDINRPQPVVYRKGIRLTEALALAGGLNTARGDVKDVRIVRGPLREPRVYTANIKALYSGKATDVELAPGDIIYVTKSWYASTSDVLNAIAPVISLAATAATFATFVQTLQD